MKTQANMKTQKNFVALFGNFRIVLSQILKLFFVIF